MPKFSDEALWADFLRGRLAPGSSVIIHISQWAMDKEKGTCDLRVQRLQEEPGGGAWQVLSPWEEAGWFPSQLKELSDLLDDPFMADYAIEVEVTKPKSGQHPMRWAPLHLVRQVPMRSHAPQGPISPAPAGGQVAGQPAPPAGETCACGKETVAVECKTGPRAGKQVCLTCGRVVA